MKRRAFVFESSFKSEGFELIFKHPHSRLLYRADFRNRGRESRATTSVRNARVDWQSSLARLETVFSLPPFWQFGQTYLAIDPCVGRLVGDRSLRGCCD